MKMIDVAQPHDIAPRGLMPSAVAVCAALLAACSTHGGPPTRPLFANFSTFTPVNANDYGIDSPNPGRPYPLHVTRFKTPGGVLCDFNPAGVGCGGSKLPQVPVDAPAFMYSDGNGYKPHSGWFSISTDQPLKAYNTISGDDSNTKVLPALHSITVDGMTCGVDGGWGIECLDTRTGGGFMLTQAWTGWVAHIAPGQPITAPPLSCSHDNSTTTCRQGEHGFSFGAEPGSYREF